MREAIKYVHYRPRPFKALFLLALGFMFGGGLIPEYLAVRHAHQAGINVPCIQHRMPPGRGS
jgi:hypothetical protein